MVEYITPETFFCDHFRERKTISKLREKEAEYAELFAQPGHALAVNPGALQFSRDQHSDSVQCPPNHKRPIRAMPDPGDKKGQEQVAIGAKDSAPVAARDITFWGEKAPPPRFSYHAILLSPPLALSTSA